MRPSSFILALVCTSILAATATDTTECGYGGYDFSGLTTHDYSFQSAEYTYYIRPCGVVDQPLCNAVESGASACQVYAPQNLAFVTGINQTLTWGLLPNSQGAYYNETGESNCWASGTPTLYSTNVEFVCAQETSLSVYVYECTQTYTISTPAACGVTPPPTPPPTSACGFENLDFSSLMNSDFEGSDGTSQYQYHLSVCGPLQDQPDCTAIDPTSSLCQIQLRPHPAAWDTGNWNNPSWFYIDESNPKAGAGYTLYGAKDCWASGAPTYYRSNVLFTCAQSQGILTVTTGGAQSCVQNYTLPTPLACGSESFEKSIFPAIATE